MKFLHTSDWHLGMTLRGGISYKEDQLYSIKHICEIAKEEKVDGILLAGDVFDRSIASQEAIQMYDELMTYICSDLNIPVYLVAGNHDGAERISQCGELLKKSGLYIAGALAKEPQVINVGDVDIYLLPWISTDKVKAVYGEIDNKIMLTDVNDEIMSTDKAETDTDVMSTALSLESAYQIVLDHYRKSFVPGHKNILVAHAYIIEGETSTSDRAAVVGTATMVGSKVFEGFDYVALGHLHGPQQINEKIRYSGTPMAYSFGREENQEKSVTIIDTDDMSQKIIPIKQLKKRTTLTGTYDELMAADFAEDIRDGYVRLEVTDSYAGMEAISLFREKYKNLLEVSSRSFDRDDEKITMTVEEFENAENDPESVFERYCQDILDEKPSEHRRSLFRDALKQFERKVAES